MLEDRIKDRFARRSHEISIDGDYRSRRRTYTLHHSEIKRNRVESHGATRADTTERSRDHPDASEESRSPSLSWTFL
jgi:hypothetical protein